MTIREQRSILIFDPEDVLESEKFLGHGIGVCALENGICAGAETACSSPGDCTGIYCGNGEIDHPLEECDDGNNESGDGCSHNCLDETGKRFLDDIKLEELKLHCEGKIEISHSHAVDLTRAILSSTF